MTRGHAARRIGAAASSTGGQKDGRQSALTSYDRVLGHRTPTGDNVPAPERWDQGFLHHPSAARVLFPTRSMADREARWASERTGRDMIIVQTPRDVWGYGLKELLT